ncbi:hypothetical protein [Candidatus Symbiopectobacterium sp. NZEC135]|uniref:hypothetical protein n=1 Tax=Candidatus Symbiopectobacterium sp. NZEC135 TaxID=2820471 RepID=UPI002225EDCA|nr:hypothetical protein [Candidatus Symbiopectobacterium sp. NZEC135]MCW2480420.1 hypothetical protein [Candidatus Symbiopectobacterium sp. NZEC135]
MTFPNKNMIGSGISKPIHPNGLLADFNSKIGNKHVASLRSITQARVQFLSQPSQATTASRSSRFSTRTQNADLGTKVRSVRGGLSKSEVKNEKNSASSFNTHDASVFNDVFNSLDSSSTFINKNEHEALDFLRNEVSDKSFDKLQTILADPNNESSAVDKAKQIFVMLKMLSDLSARSDTPNTAGIKEDIKFYVDNINKYGLGIKSPFAGSLLQGERALKNIDDRVNKNAAKLIAEGLNYNAAIDRLVESKINTVQDQNMRATLLSKWKDIAFRPSKQVFDKMEGTINGSSHFHRVDALLNHQPIKLELFKDFLHRENVGQNTDAGKTGTSTPDNGKAKETPGPTYVYYDYSTTTNDNSVHFTDKSHLLMKEAANLPKGQKENPPASATASATQHQNVTPVPERQSDRSTDGRGLGESGGLKRSETTTGTSDITVNSNKLSHETQIPPVEVGGDGPMLPREASSDTNTGQNEHTSIQQPQPPIVGNPGAHQTAYIGPFSTGRTGAAQFQKYKQPASITSDSGQFDKKNASPITPSNDASTGMKNDGAHSRDENINSPDPHVKAGKNPVSERGGNQALHAASFTRQRAQFATTLTKAKSHAAIVQSSEPQSQEETSALRDPYIGLNRTGRTGAAEFKRYWQSAKKTSSETDTLAGRREPLPGRDETALLTRSNAVGAEKTVELDGSKVNEKAHNLYETPPPKTTTSPAQTIRQQQQLNGAAGISKQKSDTYMGPHRMGRTGAADFKKYVSDSNVSTVNHALNRPGSTERDAEPLAKAVSSSTIEKRVVNKTGEDTPVTGGVEYAVGVSQHKARVEPETKKVESTDDVLLADSAPDLSAAREPSLANRHQVASSGEKNTVTAVGNTGYKGPFWTGRQGATAKQSYINTDRFAKK